MKLSDITWDNVKAFFEGNTKMYGAKFDLVPKHVQEQVKWRAFFCKDDCMVDKKCTYCGCKVPGKLYVTKSCNGGERFPDLMDEETWKEYKKENNIKI